MYLLFVKEFFEEYLPVVVTADDKAIIDDNYLIPFSVTNLKYELDSDNYCAN